MPRKQHETPAFEKSLQELEALVVKMEQGNLSLEESLQHFERGIQLTRTCQQALKAAEQKVEILLKKAGQDDITPFSGDET
jgi:exodeoxyribonuclease VII small subunit